MIPEQWVMIVAGVAVIVIGAFAAWRARRSANGGSRPPSIFGN